MLFYALEVCKAKGATRKCPNDIKTEWNIPEKFLDFLLYPWKFQTKQDVTPRFST